VLALEVKVPLDDLFCILRVGLRELLRLDERFQQSYDSASVALDECPGRCQEVTVILSALAVPGDCAIAKPFPEPASIGLEEDGCINAVPKDGGNGS
jgi:hypothetical protein